MIFNKALSINTHNSPLHAFKFNSLDHWEIKRMKRHWVMGPMVAIFVFFVPVQAQTGSEAGVQKGCVVELANLHVNSLSVEFKNTSGKKIVGLVFNVAFADATERWRWLHWDYDLNRPLQEFGWNKSIGEGESKKLRWSFDFDHEHGGGVALVLSSVLYADGSSWEEGPESASCMQIWHHRHKKGFTRPVQLPIRDEARL